MSTSLQKAIVMELLNVTKAEEGQKKMIFGRPFHYAGSKWVPDKAGPKEETSKERFKKTEEPERKRGTRGHIDPKGRPEAQLKEDILFFAKNSGIDMTIDKAEKVYDAVALFSDSSNRIRQVQQGTFRGSEESKKVIEERAKGIESLFEFYPIYKDDKGSKVYRGISLERQGAIFMFDKTNMWDEDKIRNSFKIGHIVDMKGLSSWSSDEDTARKFSINDRPGISAKYMSVVFEAENKSGISIKAMSNNYKENEILHSSKTKWKVKDVSGEFDKFKITLEEI